MSIIRSAIRSSLCLRQSDPVIFRSSLPFLQELRKCLSTSTEQPPSSPLPPPPGGSPGEGFVFPFHVSIVSLRVFIQFVRAKILDHRLKGFDLLGVSMSEAIYM